MKLAIRHKLSLDEARARIERLGDYLVKHHGFVATWKENKVYLHGTVRTTALHVTLESMVTIKADMVMLEGPDPGRATRVIGIPFLKSRLAKYLHSKTKLDDLPK